MQSVRLTPEDNAKAGFASTLGSLRRPIAGPLRLNIHETVSATIRAHGFPKFKYQPVLRRPEYLVLIDKISVRDHQAIFFHEIVKALQRRGLRVAAYFFSSDPRVCRSTTGRSCYLADLHRRNGDRRLIVFGDGGRLVSDGGNVTGGGEALLRWHQRCILTPCEPSCWGHLEMHLARYFLLLPATSEFLAASVDYFDPDRATHLRRPVSQFDHCEPDFDRVSPDDIRAFLGNDALYNWLRACALYPSLNWDMTLRLGGKLDPTLLSESCIEKLSRLPWFRRGSMPVGIQEALVKSLDRRSRLHFRSMVIETLDKIDPMPVGFSEDDRRLEIAVQRLDISPRERKKILEDAVVARVVARENLSHVSLTIPATLRDVLFPYGLPALGFRRRARQALLSFVMLAAVTVAVSAWYPMIARPLSLVAKRLHTRSMPETRRLAVLPFTAVNADASTSALARGMSEMLSERLAQLSEKHSLQVVPASELLSNHIDNLQQARRELGVNLAVEGNVELSGQMVRVTYNFINAENAQQLHAGTITGSVSDLFSVEDELVASVVRALELDLSPQEQAALNLPGSTVGTAYELFVQGRGYLLDYEKSGNLESAISALNHALELDPKYAPAYSSLGEAYFYKYKTTMDSSWLEKATGACENAIRLNERLAGAHNCLGTVYQGTGKYELAVQQFQLAVELDSASDDAVRGLASAYDRMGKSAQAEQTYQQAINLRPNYWRGYNMLGAFYYGQARYGEAATMFQRVVDLAPDNYRGYSNLGAVYIVEGRFAEAIATLQKALVIQPSADLYSNLGTTYFYLRRFPESATAFAEATKLDDRNYELWGDLANAEARIPEKQSDSAAAYGKAVALAEQALRVNPRDSFVLRNLADYYSMLGDRSRSIAYLQNALSLNPDDPATRYKAAQVYAQLGDSERAVQWLVKALNAGYPSVTVRNDPVMDKIRSDPRVQGYLASH